MTAMTVQKLAAQTRDAIFSGAQAWQSIGIVEVTPAGVPARLAACAALMTPPINSDAMKAMIVATAERRWYTVRPMRRAYAPPSSKSS
jgi:hypothetical protein